MQMLVKSGYTVGTGCRKGGEPVFNAFKRGVKAIKVAPFLPSFPLTCANVDAVYSLSVKTAHSAGWHCCGLA